MMVYNEVYSLRRTSWSALYPICVSRQERLHLRIHTARNISRQHVLVQTRLEKSYRLWLHEITHQQFISGPL
jgi:hypothetical protein